MKHYSMKSHNRRNHQRWLNGFCRFINKAIEDDPLWRGRFVIEQLATQMEWFEDNSGGLLYCKLQFRDKKTHKIEYWMTDCLELEWNAFFKMNHFIVETCRVWDLENPYKEVQDYRNIR